MNLFENFAPKSRKRSLFLIEDEEEEIRNGVEEEEKEDDSKLSLSLNAMKPVKSLTHKPSLKDRLSGFLSQFAPPSKTIIENSVVPATPRFQRTNLPIESLSHWLGESHPIWSGLTMNTNLPVNYFNEISSQISSMKNISSLFKLSSQTFQQTSADTLQNNNRDEKLTLEQYRFLITQPSHQAVYQLFYGQYEEALKDCLDKLFLPCCSNKPQRFILLYESRLKASSSSPKSLTVGGGRGVNNVVVLNQMKKNEKEQFFSYCVYDQSPSSSPASSSGSKENEIRCIVTNLKTPLFRKLIGFPDFQYLILDEEENTDNNEPSITTSQNSHNNSNHPRKKGKKNDTTSLSASGEYKQRLQGKSLVIMGEYSVKIWNYVILEAIYQKLFSFSWQTTINFTMTSSFSPSFDANREKLAVFIPSIVSEEPFSHASREKLSFQLLGSTKSLRKIDNLETEQDRNTEYQWKLSGLLTINIVREVLNFLKEKCKTHSDHLERTRLQQLLANLPPPIISNPLKKRKEEESDKENKIREEVVMKHRKSRSNVKLVNPFTFEAVKAPVPSSSSSMEVSSNDNEVRKEEEDELASNQSFVTMKPEPTESKLNYLSSSLINVTPDVDRVKLIKEMKWICNENEDSLSIMYETKPSFITRNDDQKIVEELLKEEKEREDLF